VRALVMSEDELATSQRFTRIFPNVTSHKYFKFTDKPRYYNLLLSAWEQRYSGISREAGRLVLEQLCRSKHHLKVPATIYVKKTAGGQQAIDISGLEAPAAKEGAEGPASSDSGQGSLTCSEISLNGSQGSLVSGSEASLSEREQETERSSCEMNGNSNNSVEHNGNSKLKLNGSITDGEKLNLETAVS